MKMRVVCVVVSAAVLLSALVASAQRKDPGAEFVARMQKMCELWSTMDTSKVAPYYAGDAALAFFDIAPLKYTSWAEYQKGVSAMFADMSSLQLTLGNDARATVRGNTAWGTATGTVQTVSKDGATEKMDFRWSVVWEKRGKDWLIVHEHVSFPAPIEDMSKASLYKRLGGYDAIAAVVDDFLGRLAADAQLKRFFVGSSKDTLQRIRQLVVDQLCQAAGGPCLYTGRSMKTAHEGLNITEDDWKRAVVALTATFEKFKVGARERQEVVAAIASMKSDIVTAP
jgi:hemoglobin